MTGTTTWYIPHSLLTRPDTIGILDASLRTSYRLIDVEAGKTVWWRNDSVVRLKKKGELDVPLLEMGTDKQQVERELLARLAEQIGRDLYGYVVTKG